MEKSDFFYLNKIFFYLNQIFWFKKNRIFAPRFYQIFETGLSAQSHKQHGRCATAIFGYTLAKQKVSKQQLIKVLAIYT